MNGDRLETLRTRNEKAQLTTKEVSELITAVSSLRHAINTLGERYDECVRHELGGDVCGGCRCKYGQLQVEPR